MADTIESFVTKLKEEGVEAGKAEAERIRADARADADKTIAEAKAEAERLVASAGEEAEQLLAKAKADLALAVRDTVARLRAQLEAILTDVLANGSTEALRDPAIIAEAIVAIVKAHADQAAAGELSASVQDELKAKIEKQAMSGLAEAVKDGAVRKSLISGGQEVPGFAYTVSGATIEVDPQSAVEHLMDMVNPKLRSLIQQHGDA